MEHAAFHRFCVQKLDQIYLPDGEHPQNEADRTEVFGTLVCRTASLCREHPMDLFVLWAAIWDELEQEQEFYQERRKTPRFSHGDIRRRIQTPFTK